MVYRIGVVGPEPSVERILSMTGEYRDQMEFIPYVYKETIQSREIVGQHDRETDAWLFSGIMPFRLTRELISPAKSAIYIPHTGSSLYKCLLHLIYQLETPLKNVSIDTVVAKEVDEAFQELDTPALDRYIKATDDYIPPEELHRFHHDLWLEGKTHAALTCFQSTYLSLKEAGVPVDWISPTRMVIRQSLALLAEKVKASYFRETQTGVVILDLPHFDRIVDKTSNPYHMQYLGLQLKEILIKLSEQLDGSLLEMGNGRYEIFSSRGAIENNRRMLKDTVRQLALAADSPVASGIGFGVTVHSAEVNARRAVLRSVESGEKKIHIVQENGLTLELTAEEETPISIPDILSSEQIQKIEETGISPKTYYKIWTLVRRMKWSEFTTADLATHLHMTDRNARRILSKLCLIGLAECVGKESQPSRGRPSKLFQLTSL